MSRIWLSLIILLTTLPADAKSVADALNLVGSTSETDPNGFKLMLFCIALLFVVASSLIAATVIYGFKKKKSASRT